MFDNTVRYSHFILIQNQDFAEFLTTDKTGVTTDNVKIKDR
jgi:hypothetical protein